MYVFAGVTTMVNRNNPAALAGVTGPVDAETLAVLAAARQGQAQGEARQMAMQ